MNRNILIVGGVVVIIAMIAFFFVRNGGSLAPQEVSMENPVNTTLDFYEAWLSAVHATTTDPYQEGLADTPFLSKDLRTRLKETEGGTADGIDPVLCQAAAPSSTAALPVYENENEAQVVVLPREEGKTEQSIFTLRRHNDGWYIDTIECSLGEFAPDREFSFEREGYMLKSVPPPLDSNYWYITFEQDGVMGHVTKLLFDTASVCVTVEGSESVCDSSQFVEPSKVQIQGQMTESGVEVKRLTYKKE